MIMYRLLLAIFDTAYSSLTVRWQTLLEELFHPWFGEECFLMLALLAQGWSWSSFVFAEDCSNLNRLRQFLYGN